jgi:hypothetical protein
MGWQRSIALSRNPIFPRPISYVEWELYPPHAVPPIPTLPTTRPLNANTGLPAQPPGPAAFVQPNQNNQVGVVIPPPQVPPPISAP